jgi:hypothetical protein
MGMADLSIPFEFCHQNSLEIANQRLIRARQKITQGVSKGWGRRAVGNCSNNYAKLTYVG